MPTPETTAPATVPNPTPAASAETAPPTPAPAEVVLPPLEAPATMGHDDLRAFTAEAQARIDAATKAEAAPPPKPADPTIPAPEPKAEVEEPPKEEAPAAPKAADGFEAIAEIMTHLSPEKQAAAQAWLADVSAMGTAQKAAEAQAAEAQRAAALQLAQVDAERQAVFSPAMVAELQAAARLDPANPLAPLDPLNPKSVQEHIEAGIARGQLKMIQPAIARNQRSIAEMQWNGFVEKAGIGADKEMQTRVAQEMKANGWTDMALLEKAYRIVAFPDARVALQRQEHTDRAAMGALGGAGAGNAPAAGELPPGLTTQEQVDWVIKNKFPNVTREQVDWSKV